jgi:hypothetical protein
MSFSKVLLALAFATIASARVLKSAPAPAPASEHQVIVENKCDGDVYVGNLFRTVAPDAVYNARCADYSTLKTGEQMYLTIPSDANELAYFSAYRVSDSANVVVNSQGSPDMGKIGSYLGPLVDSPKEDIGCEKVLLGSDVWYFYSIENDTITFC